MTNRKTFLVFLLGIFLVQSAWIIAMPAFRGPDEFDHVFRAEGVSHGFFMPGDDISTALARGTLTPARPSVIDAASAVCSHYGYTHYFDCHAYGGSRGELSLVGSGAGRYNPTYYFVVGQVTRFFDGVAVDYAMRVTTAVICALLLAWAAWLWVGRARSRWRTLSFVAALTPVLLFSTAIAAPNGVTYSAAVLLWAGGLAVLDEPELPSGHPSIAIAVGGAIMCNTHTTGPIWLLLIALTWLIMKPRAVVETLRRRRYWYALACVALAACASVVWTVISGANLPTDSVSSSSSPDVGLLVSNEVVWLFQTIAAFPLRNEYAYPAVYVLWLIGFTMLIVHALRTGGRGVLVIAWMSAAIIVTQTVLTYVGFSTAGYAWQGRYGLPFTVGLALVPAFLESGNRKPYVPMYNLALIGFSLAAGLSVWKVAHTERIFLQRPLTDYVAGGPWVAAVLASLGTLVVAWALSGRDVRLKR